MGIQYGGFWVSCFLISILSLSNIDIDICSGILSGIVGIIKSDGIFGKFSVQRIVNITGRVNLHLRHFRSVQDSSKVSTIEYFVRVWASLSRPFVSIFFPCPQDRVI